MLICPVCQILFDPADRASSQANEGAVKQIKYCSEACARRAENRRYYAAHRQEIITKNLERQRQAINTTLGATEAKRRKRTRGND